MRPWTKPRRNLHVSPDLPGYCELRTARQVFRCLVRGIKSIGTALPDRLSQGRCGRPLLLVNHDRGLAGAFSIKYLPSRSIEWAGFVQEVRCHPEWARATLASRIW